MENLLPVVSFDIIRRLENQRSERNVNDTDELFMYEAIEDLPIEEERYRRSDMAPEC